ncbi:hypothetical protein [Flavobacterium sp.]|uniref:hypothetical protein n=1 Tax=Flavobacterium sp. TaxID=239 RepID=UPI00391ABDD7
MKKIKILVLLLAVSVAGFYSCTDNDPVENEVVTSKSIALRTTLNEIKKANNINGRNSNSAQDQFFCFQFVYPLTLSYNDGTLITVATEEGLLDILIAETETLFITGIAFPFQVLQEGAVITIDDETEFYDLIEECGFSPINDDVLQFSCLQMVFPISVINDNGVTIVVNTQAELESLLISGTLVEIVFPISVTQNNEVIVVNDLYELFELYDECDGNSNSCICTTDYNPVCVQTVNGIVEYSNACLAECDGFTAADFVTCAPICSITNVTATPGTCNSDGTYPLTVDFDYANTSSAYYSVYNSLGAWVGTYLLFDLPFTIPNYPSLGSSSDYFVIRIGNNFDCDATQQWTAPICPTTSVNFGSQLGTCFNLAFPVQIQYQGAVITANNNGEVLQYYFPSQSNIPAFVYPLTINFNTPSGQVTVEVDSQVGFETAISAFCN